MAKTKPTDEVRTLLKELDGLYRRAKMDLDTQSGQYRAAGMNPPPQVRALVRDRFVRQLQGMDSILTAQIDTDMEFFRDQAAEARRKDALSPERLAFFQAVPALAIIYKNRDPKDIAVDLEQAIQDGRRAEVMALAAVTQSRFPILPGVLAPAMQVAEQAAKPADQREAEEGLEALTVAQERWKLVRGGLEERLDHVLAGLVQPQAAYSPEFVLGESNASRDSAPIPRPQPNEDPDEDTED